MSAPLSHAEVQTLLSESAYDPSVCPKLESYVRAQVSAVASTIVASESPDVHYSFDVSRTLVKLYQFFPYLGEERGGGGGGGGANNNGGNVVEVTALVLLLALLRYPDTDLAALCCLIPEKVQSTEPCATIVRCSELLESCDYSLFWPEFRKLGIPEYGASSSSSDDNGSAPVVVVVSDDRRLLSDAINGPIASSVIRTSAARSLARTYRSAPLDTVLAALDLADVGSLLEFGSRTTLEDGTTTTTTTTTMIVEKVEGDVVTFAASTDNTRRVGSAYKGGVSYDDVATMMSKSAARGQ